MCIRFKHDPYMFNGMQMNMRSRQSYSRCSGRLGGRRDEETGMQYGDWEEAENEVVVYQRPRQNHKHAQEVVHQPNQETTMDRLPTTSTCHTRVARPSANPATGYGTRLHGMYNRFNRPRHNPCTGGTTTVQHNPLKAVITCQYANAPSHKDTYHNRCSKDPCVRSCHSQKHRCVNKQSWRIYIDTFARSLATCTS